ncbi:hypothetical protein FSP39_008674 [Pinctada imbricata]|uniref:Uncharacterized protein n=1 Tax=Pinctada imbricata TaxID=66713 RepID=A0AA89BKQ2_PINIB|nr:hypothetical protein FSP39_008674 [Pinctada imbricata]
MISFALSVQTIFISIGCLTHTLVHGPTIVTLGKYFAKRRGFANTLSTMGGSLGGFVLPILIRSLITYYGLQGSLMVMAGLLMHFLVSGALLRPINIVGEEKSLEDLGEQNSIIEAEQQKLLTKDFSGLELPEIRFHNGDSVTDVNVQYNHKPPEPVERCRTYSSSSHKRFKTEDKIEHTLLGSNKSIDNLSQELMVSTGDMTGSGLLCFDKHDTSQKAVNDTGQLGTQNKRRNICVEIFAHMFHKRVIKNPHFLMYLPVAFTAIIGTAHFLTLLPPHAADIGLTNEDVSFLFMISGISDITSKLFLASIADCNFIKRYQLIAIGLIVFGVVTQFISFFTDFKLLAIHVVIYGTFGQMYFGLFPVMLADFVGINNLSSALGIVILVHGFALSVSNPLLGYIRDTTGSFVGSFHLMGTSLMISGAILLTEPLVRKLEGDKEKAKK